MRITKQQLRQIIREELHKVTLNEAKEEKIKPIDPKKLEKVFLEIGVKSGVYQNKGMASEDIKRLMKAPTLVNKAIDGDEDAYDDVMDGLRLKGPEYNNTDDKKLVAYYKDLSKFMGIVEDVLYHGELGDIARVWNKLKSHIESFK